MEELGSPAGQPEDRGRQMLTAACRVTEVEGGTAIYISSTALPSELEETTKDVVPAADNDATTSDATTSDATTSDATRSSKSLPGSSKQSKPRRHMQDSSMDIAPSLITLYDKYASADTELKPIKETAVGKTEPPRWTDAENAPAVAAFPATTELPEAGDRGEDMAVHSADAVDGMVRTSEAPAGREPADAAAAIPDVVPNPPNQSFLYHSQTSLRSNLSDEEKDTFDVDETGLKPRSHSFAGLLEEDRDQSTSNVFAEHEVEHTVAPLEAKPKSASLEARPSRAETREVSTEPRSTSLEKNSSPPKRKTSMSSPSERTDTNANFRGFQRTLSFGARLARTKFSQFIESNALGKSKAEAGAAKKSAGEGATTAAAAATATAAAPKTRHRLRSDSEPAPFTAVRLEPRRKSRVSPAVQSAYGMDNDGTSPAPSPISTPPLRLKSQEVSSSRLSLSYMDQKCRELLDTEENYVMDLADVIQGYKQPIEAADLISGEDQETLFGNIQEIHDFNNKLLKELQQCNNDPVLIAECFLDNEKKFRVYTDYCTNYPSTMEVLIHYTQYEGVADFFKKCQLYLGHPLPLGAYLLKPVQRVLKYHLLFQDMYKHFSKEEEGYDTIGDALVCMTDIAHYINEMKRKHEASVHVQEIQSQLVGWEGDLMSSGDLVLEFCDTREMVHIHRSCGIGDSQYSRDVFRMQGARAERYLYLFEKVLLIGKKREDGLISIKTHIPCSNLMLIESIQREPLGFNVIPYSNPSIQYTILARNMEQKKLWSHEIKRLILENYGSTIPTKVYELILRNTMSGKTDSDKETQPEVELSRDKKERKSRRRQKRRNSEPMGKLLRGQKQVKAAVENMITKGMKRPDLSRWNGRRSSTDVRQEPCHTSDESDNETAESPRLSTSACLSTPDCQSSVSATSDSTQTPDSARKDPDHLAHSLSRRRSRNSAEVDGGVSSNHSEEEAVARERAPANEGSNLTRKRESNRDSGIGSMTLSEHAATATEGEASAAGRRAVERSRDPSLAGARRRLGLEGSEEDEADAIQEQAESPDELEALESLPEAVVDPAAIGDGEAADLESLPSYVRKVSGQEEPFRLRHSNIKSYRPLGGPRGGDVWLPMMAGDSFRRSRSASHGARPLSADVAMHAPLQKTSLSRCNSDDRHMLAAVSEMYGRSHSDPNMLDTASMGEPDILPPSPPEASGENSALSSSSNENLLDTVNKAFVELGEKYSKFHLSESEAARPAHDGSDGAGQSVAASASTGTSAETSDSLTDNQAGEDRLSDLEPHAAQPHKSVIRLAREFSRKAKENPRMLVTRHALSDPCLERDGSTLFGGFAIEEDPEGNAVVRPKAPSKVTSKIETFQMALTENEAWQAPTRSRLRRAADSLYHATPAHATGSSSEEEQTKHSSPPSSAGQGGGRNLRSVRDVVRRLEKPPPRPKESQPVKPAAAGIQQRLQSIRQNAEFRKETQQEVSGAQIKSLRERRQELEAWVSRPIPRKYAKSETEAALSDAGSHYSDELDGASSYPGSVPSSAGASPVHLPRARDLSLPSLADAPLINPGPRAASEDQEPVPFRSLRERFKELEKAVSKPVPRTCVNPKEEIQAKKQSLAEELRQQTQSSSERDKEETQENTGNLAPTLQPVSAEERVTDKEPHAAKGERPILQSSLSVQLKESDESKADESKADSSARTALPFQSRTLNRANRAAVYRRRSPSPGQAAEDSQSDADSSRSRSRAGSSPIFLEAPGGSEGLHRAVSCESNYTDARSEFSTQDSSEDSFHSGYATPTDA